jgi:hypothetical protein
MSAARGLRRRLDSASTRRPHHQLADLAAIRSLVLDLGDVNAGVADGVARGGEAPAIAEVGEDRDRNHWADPIMGGDRRPASRLAAHPNRAGWPSSRNGAEFRRRPIGLSGPEVAVAAFA